jgi:hypothetical protein
MKKILFQDNETDLLISEENDQIIIEMKDSGINLNRLEIADNYSVLTLSKEEALDLANELIKLSKDNKNQ